MGTLDLCLTVIPWPPDPSIVHHWIGKHDQNKPLQVRVVAVLLFRVSATLSTRHWQYESHLAQDVVRDCLAVHFSRHTPTPHAPPKNSQD